MVEISIKADDPEEGKKFDKWEVVKGNADIIEDPTSPTTTLLMSLPTSQDSSTSKPHENSFFSSSCGVTLISTYSFNQLNGTNIF